MMQHAAPSLAVHPANSNGSADDHQPRYASNKRVADEQQQSTKRPRTTPEKSDPRDATIVDLSGACSQVSGPSNQHALHRTGRLVIQYQLLDGARGENDALKEELAQMATEIDRLRRHAERTSLENSQQRTLIRFAVGLCTTHPLLAPSPCCRTISSPQS